MGFVVVGIDGSPASRRAFEEAIRQAVWREARVKAVHVTRYPYLDGYQNFVIDSEALEASGKKLLASEVDAAKEAFGGTFPVPVEPIFVLGHPGVGISECSKEDGGAELTVLGSRGYGGIRGVLLGSVTTYLVHHLTCPLLVIPPTEEVGQ